MYLRLINVKAIERQRDSYILVINKPFSISINIEWFIVFIQSCHTEILLSIKLSIFQ